MQRKSTIQYRDIDGVLLLDKPLGISSNQALQKARRLFRAKKAGHTGSLDPMASGLLPLCFGEATKISAYLLDADKHYQTTVCLGTVTDTGDSAGTITRVREVPEFTPDKIETVLEAFRGDIQQIPPMYSALHHQGKRLYELAREGKEVERASRNVTIISLKLLESGQKSLTLDVHCSKGTYIRTLVEDIGEALGCGAHVATLRRLSVAPFQNPDMLTLSELEVLAAGDESELLDKLIPMDAALSHWSSIHLDVEQTQKILHGQSIHWEAEDTERLRIYGQNDRFIGIGQIKSSILKSKRLLRQDTGDYR